MPKKETRKVTAEEVEALTDEMILLAIKKAEIDVPIQKLVMEGGNIVFMLYGGRVVTVKMLELEQGARFIENLFPESNLSELARETFKEMTTKGDPERRTSYPACPGKEEPIE